ncbi:uncharacterized protein LOC107041330 [Diachasma alloeum]|uniref:uncharacterized protein LOC107041330 n=1 Tax=Diachasma alloeum TaxID=454923 RepID=UPI0007384374|nr:uncharacterized protein LOC107041330 [Diachasma alloeum]XP_015117319.1 uncharacterized protein LOC107041330 [Diachasma alloeum]XP_015117320.1 uncharacterized protein LOC107041330 [Diachasma alloeum]XP_015117321.1 uncharacterized protein LOC107041330 [Diachasma alloeum]XP_028982155.1 uncharacterized protein LOC107041330 [Diachasma alloeum]
MVERTEEEGIPPDVSKTVLEVLGNYSDVNSSREATNVDELMPMVRRSLRGYKNRDSSSILNDDDGPRPHPGRLSRSLIKASVKRKRIDDGGGGVEGPDEVLKRIGVPRSRRSSVFGGKKSVGAGESSSEGGDRTRGGDGAGGGPGGDPLGMTSPRAGAGRRPSADEKLIVTPAKARGFSINSDVEYERVCESVNSQDDFSFEGVPFFNNFDVINEILDDKVMASLLEDDKPRDSPYDVNNQENSHNNDDDDEPHEEEEEDEEENASPEAPRRSSRPRPQEYLDLEDSELEEILEEPTEEPLPAAVILKLRKITVKLEHPVPPQHEIEQGTIRRGPNPEERLQFQKYCTLKEGRFSPEENKILKNNWKRFCEVHDLDIPQTHFFKCKYQGRMYIESVEERRNFIKFLARGLPWRTLRAVYVRFKMMFGFRRQAKSKRYTEQDDEKIVRYMECKPPLRKSQVLSRLLGRPYASIYQRYLQLRRRREGNPPRRRVTWTLGLMEEFLKNLLDVTISEDVRDLKDAMIPKVVWLKLEELMNIEFSVLKNFWMMQLHGQLFFPRTIYFNEIKIMLIEYLYGRGITDVEELEWARVGRCFDGLTTQFLRKMCPRVMKTGRTRSMGDLVERLYEEKIPILKVVKEDSYLPRVKWEAGRLRVVDEFGDGIS